MPVHKNVTDREYREACGRLDGIISTAVDLGRRLTDGSMIGRPERRILVARLDHEISVTIACRTIRKADQDRLQGYVEGILAQMEREHTERRCWHVESRTWRPVAEGSAFRLGRMAPEAGTYQRDLTVTFWKPAPNETDLYVYQGTVPEGYGTRYSAWGSTDARQAPDRPACEAPFFVDGICRGCGVTISDHPPVEFFVEVAGQAATGAANVTLPGRHGAGQVDALFTKSGLIDRVPLTHNPILAFFPTPEGSVAVQIVKSAAEAAVLPPATPLMWQWPGKYRSDWFHFTAADLRDHLERLAERG